MTDARELWNTSIEGLDAILGGGFHPNTLTLLIGSPGAGKTVLASQIIFDVAREGVPTLIFTSFSEGNEAYIEHMRGFAFFDQALLGDTIQLFSLQGQLAEDESSPGLAVAQMIRATRARVVLIDGIQGIASLFEHTQSIRTFVATLATQLRYMDATLLLTLAGTTRDPRFHAAITAADIVLGLEYTSLGRRHQRLIEVIKQRGRAQLSGLHSYRIDSSGIQIFPRIEVAPRPTPQPHQDTRAPFGFAELDAVLGGGLNTGTTTLLAGAPGVGKTTLALAWGIRDARPDTRTLFISVSEFPEQLERKAAAFDIDLRNALAANTITIVRIPPTELDADALAHLLLTEIATGTVRRVIFDDISVLLHELADRTRDYLGALNDILYESNITSLYLLEIPAFDGLRLTVTNTPLAVFGDNIIIIQQYETEGVLRRILAVLRMKLSFFDRTLRELVLDERGIRVDALPSRILGLLESGTRLSRGSPQAPPESSSPEIDNQDDDTP